MTQGAVRESPVWAPGGVFHGLKNFVLPLHTLLE